MKFKFETVIDDETKKKYQQKINVKKDNAQKTIINLSDYLKPIKLPQYIVKINDNYKTLSDSFNGTLHRYFDFYHYIHNQSMLNDPIVTIQTNNNKIQGTLLNVTQNNYDSIKMMKYDNKQKIDHNASNVNYSNPHLFCSHYHASLFPIEINFVNNVEDQIVRKLENTDRIKNVKSSSFVFTPQKFIIQTTFNVNISCWSDYKCSYYIEVGFCKDYHGAKHLKFTVKVGYQVEGGFTPVHNRVVNGIIEGRDQLRIDLTQQLNTQVNDALSVFTPGVEYDFLLNYDGDLNLATPPDY